MTPEAKVKAKVKKVLDKLNCYYFFPATNGYGRSGVPDVIVCFQGHFIGIECKAGKGKLTALQENELKKIQFNEGSTAVINEDNVDSLEEWLYNEIQS
jgi:Holliday junction resolvase